MIVAGNLRKMQSELRDKVEYHLLLGEESIPVHELTGMHIRIEYKNQIHCIRCGRLIKKSFAQGYCYPCFIAAPETEDCVLRPELCKAHTGVARDMEFAKNHCLIDHYVYLAESGGLKVGVTRHSQVPTRWIDQGAGRAVRVAKTPNRYLAGCIEVALKNYFRDKTNWRDMLMNKEKTVIDLSAEKSRALSFLHPDFRVYACDDDDILKIQYPVSSYPVKVKSVNFDKTPSLNDILTGIRGQYLIFENGMVLNIRKHGGYFVEMSW